MLGRNSNSIQLLKIQANENFHSLIRHRRRLFASSPDYYYSFLFVLLSCFRHRLFSTPFFFALSSLYINIWHVFFASRFAPTQKKWERKRNWAPMKRIKQILLVMVNDIPLNGTKYNKSAIVSFISMGATTTTNVLTSIFNQMILFNSKSFCCISFWKRMIDILCV